MDKRLYRMRLLNWYLEENKSDRSVFEEYLKEYRKVLFEWNDTLIRNLALIEAYFGREIQNKLEGIIYEEFARIGKLLENQIVEWRGTGGNLRRTNIGSELDKLSQKIYQLNFDMISEIQEGNVGIHRECT